MAPQFGQVRRGGKAAAILHDELKQRFAGQWIVVRRGNVMVQLSADRMISIDLFAAGPGGFAL